MKLETRALVSGIVAALILNPLAAQTIISTYAGTDWLFPGDRRPALEAPMGRITDVTIDRQGRVVFADQSNQMVMRVNRDGRIEVVAGNGIASYSGDGGPAVNASLNAPTAVAVDSQDNLYIADSFNHRVRKVTPQGDISTIAGNGVDGFAGDGGRATDASLNSPNALAIDAAGLIYIGDRGNLRIRRVALNGTISTIAGTGGAYSHVENGPAAQAGLGAVQSLTLDSSNSLYLTEFDRSSVRRITSAGLMQLVARVDNPSGVAINQGTLYVTSKNQILRADADRFVATAGAGAAGFADGASSAAQFNAPSGIVFDAAGAMVVADRENFRVRRVASGSVTTLAGNGAFHTYPNGTVATQGFFSMPYGVSLDRGGAVLIPDTEDARVRRVSAEKLSTIAGNGVHSLGLTGVQATSTSNLGPKSAAMDRDGNIYYSDAGFSGSDAGHVIRRVAANGIVTTFAGNGHLGLGRESMPAVSEPMADPRQIYFDAQDDLYIAETAAHRIRVVSKGMIRTLAGGTDGRSGQPGAENVAAFGARLFAPEGVAADAFGNIYISDTGNHAVRIVDRSGNMRTVTGTGTRVLRAGESAPARDVRLISPSQLAVDGDGALYIADYDSEMVYKFAGGLLSSIAGIGDYGFSGDGGLATDALLAGPGGVVVDSQGNVFIADTGNNRIRVLQKLAPKFSLAPERLSFRAKSGGGTPTPESLVLTGSMTGLRFAATVSESASEWLSLSNRDGVMPVSLQVRIDPTTLDAGTYRGTISIVSEGAQPRIHVVEVELVVEAADPPQLGIEQSTLSFTVPLAGAAVSQFLRVQNTGGGSLEFAATPSTSDGAGWLRITVDKSAVVPNEPATIEVNADPKGLDPGSYTGTVVIRAPGLETRELSVTLTVSETRPRIVVSQAALRFTAVAQGPAPSPQTIAIVNAGRGNLNYRVDRQILSGSDWLKLDNNTGAISATAASPALVTASVDASGMEAGYYYALIRVNDPQDQATNNPQNVAVYLTLLPAGSSLRPEATPSGLVFQGPRSAKPGSQNVFLSNTTGATLQFDTTRDLPPNQDWLTVVPPNGSILSGDTGKLLIQPIFERASPGINKAKITVSYSDSSVQTIDVVAVITDEATSKSDRLSTTCPVEITVLSPRDEFAEPAETPIPLRLKVHTACKVFSQAATVAFDNGDPTVTLRADQNEEWVGTWTPRNKNVSRVKLSFLAYVNIPPLELYGKDIVGQFRKLVVDLPPAPPPPIRTAIVNSTTYESAPMVAPGGLVTIFGQDLANDTAEAPNHNDLPRELAGTRVELAGKPLPLLYVSKGQINAVIPYGLKVNDLQSMVVVRDTVPSVPSDLAVARTRPGIFTPDASGKGQGSIYKRSADGSLVLVGPENPAKPGDEVTILCAGLGEVSPAVEAGTLPPSGVAARVVNAPVVRIGNRAVTLASAVLSADVASRYDLRVVLPQDVELGNAVSVTLQTAGYTSPPVTMAIQGAK